MISRQLFVYGTLLQGLRDDIRKRVHARFVGTGSIRARLYNLGRYPGAKPSTNSGDGATGEPHRVRGVVYRLPAPKAALITLDEYEDIFPHVPGKSVFVRELVSVTLDDGNESQAWAYFYSRPVDESRLIESGDYREFLGKRAIEAINQEINDSIRD